jgi:hypothetical protein
MSTFGDLVPYDAFDPAKPEAGPLARAILAFERVLARDPKRAASLEDLHPNEMALRIFVAAYLIQRLQDEGVLP